MTSDPASPMSDFSPPRQAATESLTPEHPLSAVLRILRSEILATGFPVDDFYLFGSAVAATSPGDLDVALVVADNVNMVAFLRTIAPIVASTTASTGHLLTCVPLARSRVAEARSQFIENVVTYGLRF